MRKIHVQSKEQEVIYEVTCNKCGNSITKDKIQKVDYVTISKEWNYFSDKDNQCHEIHLCEHCYNEWIKTFACPPTIKHKTTFL